MRRIFATGCLFLLIVSCGDDEADQLSVITGTVVEVDSQGLTEVSSFVVSSDGERHRIAIDHRTQLDFPPAHLNEHRISGDPVKVDVLESNGTLVAITIEDT